MTLQPADKLSKKTLNPIMSGNIIDNPRINLPTLSQLLHFYIGCSGKPGTPGAAVAVAHLEFLIVLVAK